MGRPFKSYHTKNKKYQNTKKNRNTKIMVGYNLAIKYCSRYLNGTLHGQNISGGNFHHIWTFLIFSETLDKNPVCGATRWDSTFSPIRFDLHEQKYISQKRKMQAFLHLGPGIDAFKGKMADWWCSTGHHYSSACYQDSSPAKVKVPSFWNSYMLYANIAEPVLCITLYAVWVVDMNAQ